MFVIVDDRKVHFIWGVKTGRNQRVDDTHCFSEWRIFGDLIEYTPDSSDISFRHPRRAKPRSHGSAIASAGCSSLRNCGKPREFDEASLGPNHIIPEKMGSNVYKCQDTIDSGKKKLEKM
jgi:hypothetical protein